MTPQLVITKQRLTEPLVALEPEELHYLRNVLRLTRGDTVIVADGAGRRYKALIERLTKKQGALAIVQALSEHTESPLRLHLIQAIPRTRTMDMIIQKATELGTQAIQPVLCTRSFRPSTPSVAQKWVDRWQKIAAEAANQSGRARVPSIQPIKQFDQNLSLHLPDQVGYIFWEQEQELPFRTSIHDKPGIEQIKLLIGPEGGFTKHEVDQALADGWSCVSLGSRILRCETAALVALTLAQHRWGDLG